MQTIVFKNILKSLMPLYFVWGGSPWGGLSFGASSWGSGGASGATYWETSYTTTGDWTTAYGAQWTEAYNTEIP